MPRNDGPGRPRTFCSDACAAKARFARFIDRRAGIDTTRRPETADEWARAAREFADALSVAPLGLLEAAGVPEAVARASEGLTARQRAAQAVARVRVQPKRHTRRQRRR